MSEPSPTRRVPKQEQERATDEIIEVAPGILRAQLPIDFTGLGHVNCYLLEDRDGVAIVDPGLPGPSSYKALRQRLTAGLQLVKIQRVIAVGYEEKFFTHPQGLVIACPVIGKLSCTVSIQVISPHVLCSTAPIAFPGAKLTVDRSINHLFSIG